MSESVTIRCPSCHRRERWTDGLHEVESPGGARRPTVHPELAAWRTVLAARRGQTDPVVGRCAGCEQPMIGPAEAVPWTIHTPQGALVVDGVISGPKGEMSLGDADFWVEEQLREQLEIRPALWLFQATVLSTMVVPFLLWVTAMVCFMTFILNYGRG
jgi:hypothetical protein